MFVLAGNVRISDLGLAVELADGQFNIKGYAGTPGTVETMQRLLVFGALAAGFVDDTLQLEQRQTYCIQVSYYNVLNGLIYSGPSC